MELEGLEEGSFHKGIDGGEEAPPATLSSFWALEPAMLCPATTLSPPLLSLCARSLFLCLSILRPQCVPLCSPAPTPLP